MTTQELFEIITKIMSSHHTEVTEQDKLKAIRVFLGFEEYLIDNLPGYCKKKFEFDFGAFASEKLDELEGK